MPMLVKNDNFELRKIAFVRSFLAQGATVQLVSSLILSYLDYCDSVLDVLLSEELLRFQNIQNNAARLAFSNFKIKEGEKKKKNASLLTSLNFTGDVEFRVEYVLVRHFRFPPLRRLLFFTSFISAQLLSAVSFSQVKK